MTSALSALLTLTLGTSATGADAQAMRVTQLEGPIYLVEDTHYVATNLLLYVGPRSVTVIGATWTPETARILAREVRRITKLPINQVIDTSPDPEWSGGNAYWRQIGARIMASEVTCEYLVRRWRETVASFRKAVPTYPDLPLVRPTNCYRGDFSLQHGKVQAMYLGPSHTDADIFVYFPQEKVLDAGSILKEQLGNMANANVAEYPKTLRRLKARALPIRLIVSGHWSPVHRPELIDRYLQMLDQNPGENLPLPHGAMD